VKTYRYQINFDENATFYADVLDSDNPRGESIFDVIPLERNGEFFFQAYGMKHKNDIDGLEKFLKEIGVIEENARVISLDDFVSSR
jgi:hypothetical protein